MKNKFYDVTRNGDGVFSTRSGQLIDIMNPTADMIRLEDIALALSHVCRFGGQVNHFYSVAQHSVLVSYLCDQKHAMCGLMHDAAEAYIGDVIKPLKNILGDVYEDIETKFTYAIFDKFGLDPDAIKNIEQADKQALQIEHDYLRGIDTETLNKTLKSYGLISGAWSSFTSRSGFMGRYADILFYYSDFAGIRSC